MAEPMQVQQQQVHAEDELEEVIEMNPDGSYSAAANATNATTEQEQPADW
jgi:hypothetical protein